MIFLEIAAFICLFASIVFLFKPEWIIFVNKILSKIIFTDYWARERPRIAGIFFLILAIILIILSL